MDHEVCGFASIQALSRCVDSRGWIHTVCPKKQFCDEPQQNGDETEQYVMKHLQLRPRVCVRAEPQRGRQKN